MTPKRKSPSNAPFFNPASARRYGNKLRLWRCILRLSQEELAQAAGIARNTIAHAEQGKTEPYDYTKSLIRDAVTRLRRERAQGR